MLMAWASQQYGAGTPFVPEDLGAKLLAWWDAEDATTLTLSGSQIAAWADKVTATSLSQGIGGSRPLYNATGFNGRPAAMFDSIDDYLEIASVFLPIGADPCEMFALNNAPAAADTAVRVSFAYGAAVNNDRRMRRQVTTGTGRFSPVVGTATQVSITVTDEVYEGDELGIALFHTTQISSQVYPSTTFFTNAAVPATIGTRTRLGCNASASPGNYWSGAINSVIVTDELTTQERNNLIAYMAGRL